MTKNADDAPQTFIVLALRIEEERRRARPVIHELAKTIDEWWDGDIPDEWRNVGFVNALNDAAQAALCRAPRAAASLAHLAVVVGLSIAPDEYPAWVVTEAAATAWRRVAQAAHYRSDYDAAVRALDAADKHLATNERLVFDRALSTFVRAIVYSDMRRFAESAELLVQCERVFRTHKDRALQGQCLLLRGMNLHRQHSLTDAATLFTRAAAILRRTSDVKSYGSALQQLGVTHLDLQQHSKAATALHDALAIFMDLGLHAEIARTKGVIGRVSMAMGRFEEARDVLTESRRMFLALLMPEEAGLAGLELIEIFLALDDRFRATAVTEEVLAEFIHANLNHRATTALAYLRDMIPRPCARQAVRHVKEYVSVLRFEPERVFAPLPQHERFGES